MKALAQVSVTLPQFRESMTLAAMAIGRSLRQFSRTLTGAFITTVKLAGLEARMQVRAGLDPAYAESPDALVQAILANEVAGLPILRLEHRAVLAVAAMRGWSESRGQGRPQVCAHRLFGDTRVSVGVA